jgi:hypothetical protein
VICTAEFGKKNKNKVIWLICVCHFKLAVYGLNTVHSLKQKRTSFNVCVRVNLAIKIVLSSIGITRMFSGVWGSQFSKPRQPQNEPTNLTITPFKATLTDRPGVFKIKEFKIINFYKYISLLTYFPKLGLCDFHAACVKSPYQLLNSWTDLYETWYVCHGT